MSGPFYQGDHPERSLEPQVNDTLSPCYGIVPTSNRGLDSQRWLATAICTAYATAAAAMFVSAGRRQASREATSTHLAFQPQAMQFFLFISREPPCLSKVAHVSLRDTCSVALALMFSALTGTNASQSTPGELLQSDAYRTNPPDPPLASLPLLGEIARPTHPHHSWL